MFFSHNYGRIKIDSYDSLSLEKTLTLHNVIILIKSALIIIKITTTIIYLYKNVCFNHQKIMIINKFLYKL